MAVKSDDDKQTMYCYYLPIQRHSYVQNIFTKKRRKGKRQFTHESTPCKHSTIYLNLHNTTVNSLKTSLWKC